MTPADVLPGALAVLQALKQRGILAGLASVSKNAFTVIDKLQIGQYFAYIADAAKITKGKPDPEIFLTVAANLGVAPKTVWAWRMRRRDQGHQGCGHVWGGNRRSRYAEGSR